MANGDKTIDPGWARLAATIGVAALAAHGVGLWLRPDEFFRGYLVAYNFWLAVAVGSLAILMTHQLTGGAWGYLLRHVLLKHEPELLLLLQGSDFGRQRLPQAWVGDLGDQVFQSGHGDGSLWV